MGFPGQKSAIICILPVQNVALFSGAIDSEMMLWLV
jgi:hypothetical protein